MKHESNRNNMMSSLGALAGLGRWMAGLAALCAMMGPISSAGSERDQARQLLATAGVKGGLIVHLGCGDGKLTAALPTSEGCLVHGLDVDPNRVETARQHVQAQGLSGSIVIERLMETRLPYIDNLVNLIVVQERGGVTDAELLRVLAPQGKAIAVNSQGKIVGPPLEKPWPSEIDEWTHYLHDASGNALGNNTEVGPPRHIQWWASPKRSRHHDSLASMSAMVSASGRIFYILDEGPIGLMHYPSQWKLIARDAFNGIVLWKQDIGDWINQLYYFRSGPNWLPRRLVAVGDRLYVTLGLEAPICALDAATGRRLKTYAGSERTEELIWHKNLLLAVVGDPKFVNNEAPKIWGIKDLFVEAKPPAAKAIVAYESGTGQVVWRKDGGDLASIAPLTLAASGESVFYLDQEHLHCLDLPTGRERWQFPFPTKGLFLRGFAPTLVAGTDVVLCMSEQRLTALAAGDGRKLWETKGNLGFCSPGDLFVTGDKVWTTPIEFNPVKGLSLLGQDNLFKALDLQTGAVKQTVDKRDCWTIGHHHRCYRNKATTNFMITGRRGMEFIGLNGQPYSVNNWVRGLCQYGIMPANGLCYVPPEPCRCFSTEKIDGFWALRSQSSLDKEAPAPAAERLLRGPAYGQLSTLNPQPPTSSDWPTYRRDPARSGAAKTSVPSDLGLLWQADLGGSLTSPVAAENRIWVADKNSRTLFCLDAQTGKQLWQFAGAGALDSPPTCFQGLVFFGCLDGYVYALRASDGALVWRFRAAPLDRRVVSDDRLESVWPVSGSVLVLDGVVYGAAGRSSHLDGGIHMFGLEARTGRLLYSKRICGLPSQPTSGKMPALPSNDSGPNVFNAPALPDVLVAEGGAIMMRQLAFDKQLEPERSRNSFLQANSGLLEDVWSARYEWSFNQSKGKLLAFDEDAVYSLLQPYALVYANQPASHRGEHHQQFATYSFHEFPTGVRLDSKALHPAVSVPVAQSQAVPADATQGKAKGNKRAKKKAQAAQADAGAAQGKGSNKGKNRWDIQLPLQARAMVLAGQKLFVAGWLDQVAVQIGTGAAVSKNPAGPARIWSLSTVDGSKLAEYPLSAPPVFDGLIAAREKLFVSTSDGKLVCFGGRAGKP